MKILVFLQGTILMHKNAAGKPRDVRVQQSAQREQSVLDYKHYIPIGKSVEKLREWKRQGADIVYLSSHVNTEDIRNDNKVLKKYHFPDGEVLFRTKGDTYKDIAEKIVPDVLIEDDCESIGGEHEMTITYVQSKVRKKIKSIVVKEFSGIDALPDNIEDLLLFNAS